MSLETTKRVMHKYFNSDHEDVSMMAPDVTFTTMADGQETQGPEGVQQMLHYFYQVAFEATAEQRNLIFSEENTVWEGEFVGKHIGEFAGIPATGKQVQVPLCVVYDIEKEQIKRARIYLEMPVLLHQLGIEM